MDIDSVYSSVVISVHFFLVEYNNGDMIVVSLEVAVTQYWLASVNMTDVIKAPTSSLRTPVKTSKIRDKPLIVCSGSNAW